MLSLQRVVTIGKLSEPKMARLVSCLLLAARPAWQQCGKHAHLHCVSAQCLLPLSLESKALPVFSSLAGRIGGWAGDGKDAPTTIRIRMMRIGISTLVLLLPIAQRPPLAFSRGILKRGV